MDRCFPVNSATFQKYAVYGPPKLKEKRGRGGTGDVYACPWREMADAYPETHFHALFSFLNSLLCQGVKKVLFLFFLAWALYSIFQTKVC